MPRPNPSRQRPQTIKAVNPDETFEISPGNLFKLVVLTALAYLMYSGGISVNLNLKAPENVELAAIGTPKNASQSFLSEFFGGKSAPSRKPAAAKSQVPLPKSAYNNVAFAIDPDFGSRYGLPQETAKQKEVICTQYIQRYAPVAVAEMRKFGVPASITLAQGLLESNAGESTLTKRSNNHFGIKCFSKKCAKGHCINMADDTHKDFFVKFNNSWGSFRAHSEFLRNSPRYQSLFRLDQKNYRKWAFGLASAGYATDKKYGEKLIAIIENLRLDRFDKVGS